MKKKYKILIVLLIMIIAIAVGIYAKYTVENKKETLYIAESFYFESDILSDSNDVSTYTFQEGANSIKIDLKNNIDDLRWADVDIEYNVKIRDLDNNQVVDKNGNTILDKNGLLNKGQISQGEIEFNNLTPGTYTVTATAVRPYEKTIKANFVITGKDDNISYEVKDVTGSPVLQLTILSNDYNGNLKITWPAGVAPDNTDEKFESINSGYNQSNKIVNFPANSEYVIQFFKQDLNRQFTKSDFMVERSN